MLFKATHWMLYLSSAEMLVCTLSALTYSACLLFSCRSSHFAVIVGISLASVSSGVAILLRVPEVLAWSVHFFGGRSVVWVSYTPIALDEDENGDSEEVTHAPNQNGAWRLMRTTSGA